MTLASYDKQTTFPVPDVIPEVGEVRHIKLGKSDRTRPRKWVICPKCNKGRWVCLDNIKYFNFTGLCQQCRRKPSYINKGYVYILLNPDDFFYPMHASDRYVLEHRLVMAKSLGRCLQPWEIVHHKNGIKDDNRLSNLKLTTHGSHLIEHNKGYQDGYRQGYQDGQTEELRELKQQIKLLQLQIKESKTLT